MSGFYLSKKSLFTPKSPSGGHAISPSPCSSAPVPHLPLHPPHADARAQVVTRTCAKEKKPRPLFLTVFLECIPTCHKNRCSRFFVKEMKTQQAAERIGVLENSTHTCVNASVAQRAVCNLSCILRTIINRLLDRVC